MTPPVVLTIAASDSGGGAGIQADLETFAAFRVFGTSAVTALTAQNTVEVRAIHRVDASFVVDQIEAVLDDLPVTAVKTGLLVHAATVSAVARLAQQGRLPNLVVDPVMVASTGRRLLEPTAERAYLEQLVPCASVLTPNCQEAAAMLGTPVHTLAQRRDAAAALGAHGATVVVVTGGDKTADSEAVDVIWGVPGLAELRSSRIATVNTHGSGCSFAAAVAAGLARGRDTRDALSDAKAWVHEAIRRGAPWRLGAGHGPLSHWVEPHSATPRSSTPRSSS